MSWLNEVIGTEKAIIAMCHLQALPGDPYYDKEKGMDYVVEAAYKDLMALQNGGVDAIMFSNEFSLPYLTDVRTETIAAMGRVIGQLLSYSLEREMISEFEAEYPNIHVEIMNVPAMETYNKLLLTTQAGNPPDVFWNFWTAGAAANDLLEDLGPYVTDEYLEDVNDAMLGICELDGKLYGLPWRSSSNIYIANADVIEAAGLEMPDDENWNWDEFKTFITALRDKEKEVYSYDIFIKKYKRL